MTNLALQKCGNFHSDSTVSRVYIQCWPFDGFICDFCGDVGVEWNPVKQFAFDALIGWWWQGKVLIKV